MIRGQTSLVLGGVGAMNLALEKGEMVTTGGKGRGEIGSEAGEVTGGCKCAYHGWLGRKV